MIGVSKLLPALAILGVAFGQHITFQDSCHAAGVPDAYPAWGYFDTVQVSSGSEYVLYYESFSPFTVDLKGAAGASVDVHEIGFRGREDNFFQTTAGKQLTVNPDSWDYVCYELVVNAPAESEFSLVIDLAVGGGAEAVVAEPQVVATTTDACDAVGVMDAFPAFDYFDTAQVAGEDAYETYFITNRNFNVFVSSGNGDPMVHVQSVSSDGSDVEVLVTKGETGVVTSSGLTDVCYKIRVYANAGVEYQLILEPSVTTSDQTETETEVPTEVLETASVDPCTAAGIVDAFPAFDTYDTDQVAGSEPFVAYFVTNQPFNVFLTTEDDAFAQAFVQEIPLVEGVDGVFVRSHDIGLITPKSAVDTCYKVSVFTQAGVKFELDMEAAPETAAAAEEVLSSVETKSSGFPVKAAVLGAVAGAAGMAVVAVVAAVVVKRQQKPSLLG